MSGIVLPLARGDDTARDQTLPSLPVAPPPLFASFALPQTIDEPSMADAEAPAEDVMDHEPSPPPPAASGGGADPPAAELPPGYGLHPADQDRMVVDHIPAAHPSTPVPSTRPDAATGAAAEQLVLSAADSPSVFVAVHANNRPAEERGLQDRSHATDDPTPNPAADDGETDRDTESSMAEEDEVEDDYDSEESFLAEMVEDLSTPSKEERERMERLPQTTATDVTRWEKQTFKHLEDPEYIPIGTGRIAWTLEGFHGTKAAPNKKRVMRSPPIVIGGFKFNIKVFPRGNEGTDHVSVYVECSGPVDLDPPSVSKGEPAPEASMEEQLHAGKTAPESRWEIPAQIGCVMYNPKEPRVFKMETASHQFQQSSQDWGWARFYGPWTTLHTRRRDQWKPMLQEDRLGFTVFIRTIRDPTRALWWRHLENNRWNNLAKTGLRGVESIGMARNAICAALTPWLHLTPFQKLLVDAPAPAGGRDSHRRSRPLFEALRRVLYLKHREESFPVDLNDVERTLEWYGEKFPESTDVVEIWENLRAFLNLECHGEHPAGSGRADVLSFIKTIKVKYEPRQPSQLPAPWHAKHATAQSIVDEMSRDGQTSYEEWEGYPNNGGCLPPVLQIELQRQRYDCNTREWKRPTHKIKINESIQIGNVAYRLFGLVITKGKLGSGKTYSIVRSSNIHSQWARYKSGTVTLLTRRQAIEAHEGHGESREGQESVAQVLLYIREDSAGEVLPAGNVSTGDPIMAPIPNPEPPPPAVAPTDFVTVEVRYANAFAGHQGPGVLDLHRPVVDDEAGVEFANHFTLSSTAADVAEYLNKKFPRLLDSNQQFECSLISRFQPPYFVPPHPIRGAPLLKFDEVLKSSPNSTRIAVWARLVPRPILQEQPSADGVPAHLEIAGTEVNERNEIFIKLFDPGQSKVTGLTTITANGEATLKTSLAPILSDRKYALYLELASGYDVKRTSMTLDEKVSALNIPDGSVIVLVPSDGVAVTSSSADTDRFSEVAEHYQRLRNLRHWRYKGTHYHKSYLGGTYLSAQLQNGLITGAGIKVAANGDYYTGSFRNGLIHGEGSMYYHTDGNMYNGSWYGEERSGYGRMVYGRTGNVYEGEWRAGRRHGSGTMSFKQADEQLQQCHICYTNEIDALFYRCGHILACEMCARQCNECPVCRRPIDAVVKIFDMRQAGI